jgi:hypothetical protein
MCYDVMINLKKQLEESKMKKIQEIISKAIENKMELKIDENLETNIENFTISHDDFLDYHDLVSSLLSFSEMTLSKSDMNNYYSSLEKCNFTNDDFINYLVLESQIWKVLDENVQDKEFVGDVYSYRLENDFDDFMTDNRKKVFELNLDQTEVWKELEPRIENGIGKKKYPGIIQNQNWKKSIRKNEGKVTFSKEYREILQDQERRSSVPETPKKIVKRPPSPIWLKRELASSIGITICSKCGTQTKMKRTESGLDSRWYGFAICPKCGHKENWLSGDYH